MANKIVSMSIIDNTAKLYEFNNDNKVYFECVCIEEKNTIHFNNNLSNGLKSNSIEYSLGSPGLT